MLVGSFCVDVFLVVCGFVVCKCATTMYVQLQCISILGAAAAANTQGRADKQAAAANDIQPAVARVAAAIGGAGSLVLVVLWFWSSSCSLPLVSLVVLALWFSLVALALC